MTCLDALKRPVDPANRMLITLIYRQLPKNLRKQIAKLDDHSTIPKVMDIINQHIKTSKQMKFMEETDDESESDDEMNSYNRKYRNAFKPTSQTDETQPYS